MSTGALAVPVDWSRYRACHMCGVPARRPCRNLRSEPNNGTGPLPGADPLRVKPHPERLVDADRDPAGVMILGRREHMGFSRLGGHGAAAHHVSVRAVAACSGALLVRATLTPLTLLSRRERCQRPSCKRLWLADEEGW